MSRHNCWVFIGDEQRGTEEALREMIGDVLAGVSDVRGCYAPWDYWDIVEEPQPPGAVDPQRLYDTAFAICSKDAGYIERELDTGIKKIENPDWELLIDQQVERNAGGYVVKVSMHT